MTGAILGRWTVISTDNFKTHNGAHYLCRCKCGTERSVAGYALRRGSSTSCGCLAFELLGVRSTKHGLERHPLKKVWDGMKQRCYNPNHTYFDRYGGRGIEICERWHSLENFVDDNGKLWQPGLTIERKDNDGHYEPNNCCWIPYSDQAKNRNNTIRLTLNKTARTIPEWSKLLSIRTSVLRNRLRQGWSHERILTTPVSVAHVQLGYASAASKRAKT